MKATNENLIQSININNMHKIVTETYDIFFNITEKINEQETAQLKHAHCMLSQMLIAIEYDKEEEKCTD